MRSKGVLWQYVDESCSYTPPADAFPALASSSRRRMFIVTKIQIIPSDKIVYFSFLELHDTTRQLGNGHDAHTDRVGSRTNRYDDIVALLNGQTRDQ